MSTTSVLQRILRDVALSGGEATYSTAEIGEWPTEIVRALRTDRILRPAKPTATVVCPGCEENCPMPVEVLAAQSGKPARAFVACDKREDIGRVPIPLIDLERSAVNARDLARAVARLLGFEDPPSAEAGKHAWRLGRIKGEKHRADAILTIDNAVQIELGGQLVPLADVFGYQAGALAIDADYLVGIVDRERQVRARHVPSTNRREERRLKTIQRHEAWRQAYRKLKRQKPGKFDTWYSRQIAKMPVAEGRDSETIRRVMKTL